MIWLGRVIRPDDIYRRQHRLIDCLDQLGWLTATRLPKRTSMIKWVIDSLTISMQMTWILYFAIWIRRWPLILKQRNWCVDAICHCCTLVSSVVSPKTMNFHKNSSIKPWASLRWMCLYCMSWASSNSNSNSKWNHYESAIHIHNLNVTFE